MKDKKHMIISIFAEIPFGKIHHPLMIKTLRKVVIKGIYLNIIKAICDKPTADIIFNDENLKAFLGRKKDCPHSSLLFSTVGEVPDTAIRQEK